MTLSRLDIILGLVFVLSHVALGSSTSLLVQGGRAYVPVDAVVESCGMVMGSKGPARTWVRYRYQVGAKEFRGETKLEGWDATATGERLVVYRSLRDPSISRGHPPEAAQDTERALWFVGVSVVAVAARLLYLLNHPISQST